MIRHIFFCEQAYFVYLHLEICASQIFMAGNGSVINTIRLACLGKSNGQPFSLSLEGLFFHAPYSVSNQSNKPVENLEMCEIRVNTHILTGIPHALIYLFSKRYTRKGTLFSGVFRLLLSCLKGLYGGTPLPAPLVSPFCCRCTRCYAICSVFTLQSKVTNTSAGAICGIGNGTTLKMK